MTPGAENSLVRLIAISTGLGIPAGVLAYALRNYISPEVEVPSTTTFTEMPLISSVGPQRSEKLAGLYEKLIRNPQKVLQGMYMSLPPESNLALLGGGALGAGLGYGLTGRVMEDAKMLDLDKQLAEKEQLFNQLLLKEQLAASGVKEAEVLDEVITTIFEDEFEKEADGKSAATDVLTSQMFPVLLAIAGAAYGGYKGWSNTVAQDRNRAVADALRSSLEERLMGNIEGPKAPMIVKVKTDRIGSTPLAGGSGRSSKRDVLSRL